MSYVPNTAMPHAVEEPDEEDGAQADLRRPHWWKIAGGVGIGLAIAAPGVVGLLRARDGRKAERRTASKSSGRAAGRSAARGAGKSSARTAGRSSAGKVEKPAASAAGKAHARTARKTGARAAGKSSEGAAEKSRPRPRWKRPRATKAAAPA